MRNKNWLWLMEAQREFAEKIMGKLHNCQEFWRTRLQTMDRAKETLGSQNHLKSHHSTSLALDTENQLAKFIIMPTNK